MDISLLKTSVSLSYFLSEGQTRTRGGEREEPTVLTQSQQQRDESPQQVMSVIYLVSHIIAHLREQTAQNVNQSFLPKYIWSRPFLP